MPLGTAAQMKTDLRDFAKLLGIDVRQVRRKVALDLFTKIVLRTPVDTGRLRASWAMSDGSPLALDPVGPKGNLGEPGSDAVKEAATALAKQNIKSSSRSAYDITWIATGLPYATAIEFGHSQVKAPAGMVRVSIAEVETELQGTLQRLR